MIGKFSGEYVVTCDYGGKKCSGQLWTAKTKKHEADKVRLAAGWKQINGQDKCPGC